MPAPFKSFIPYLFFCFILLPFTGVGQALPSVPKWVADIGGPGSSSIASLLKVDAQNNTYVTGIYMGTVDFDPSPGGVKNLTSVGDNDAFIAKYDTNGALIWAKSVGGPGTDQPSGISVDNNGNVAITGQYNANMDADPGAAVYNLVNAGDFDMFLINLDVNGNFMWAKTIGGFDADFGSKVAIDMLGNRIMVGGFNSTIQVGTKTYNASGTNGLCVKYDQAGNVIWSMSFGQSGDNRTVGVEADNNNDIIISGTFSGTVNFNPLGTASNLTSTVLSSYVAKYTPAGQLIWVMPIKGNAATNICVDMVNNNIYATGTFTSPVTFATGQTLNPIGTQDLFIAKYAANGTFQWGKGLGGNGSIFNNGIAVDNDNVYVSGYFNGSIDFDGSAANATLNYHGQRDLFLVKYNSTGNYQWAINAGNSNCSNTFGRSVGVDSNGDILFTGAFCSTANFDVSGCTTYNLTATGARDVFLAKYTPAATMLANNVITAPAVTAFCGSADPDVITGSMPTGGSGVYTYQWQSSADGVSYANINNATALNYDPPVITAKTYYRRLVTSGSCTAVLTSNAVLVQAPLPMLSNNIITAPAVTTFCNTGNPSAINGSNPVGGDGTYAYQWQSSTDNATFTDITGAVAAAYTPGVLNVTTYYKRKVTSGPCTQLSNVITININAAPIVVVSPNTSICVGSATNLNATGGTTYQWLPSTGLSATNIANPVASPLVTTTYVVTVSNGSCSSTASVTIKVIPKPVVNAGTDKDVLKGNSVQLTGAVTGTNVQYSWSPATYLDDPNSLSPIATPTENITYTLTATSDQGCFIVSDDVAVKVYPKLVIPNTFTPNSDGVNDNWDIATINTYPNNTVTIFARNGMVVFRSIGYNTPWDGRYNGKLLPFATYYYVIDLKNGDKPISGWVAIIK